MSAMARIFKILTAVALTMAVSFGATAKPAVPVVELTRVNTMIFASEISPVTADNFMATLVGKRVLLDSLDPKATLYLVIVSNGGMYEQSLMMRALLRRVPNVTLICKYCASAGGFIFAATGIPRLAIKKTVIMMHEMYLPHYTAAMTKDPRIARSLVKSSDEFNAAMYNTMGISKQEYEKKIIGKEWNVYGEEAVKLKLADKFVQIKCDPYIKSIAPDTCSSDEKQSDE